MSTFAQAACLRCRGQKLRCSRDLPICARCKRLNANCIFPEPVDRKHRPTLRRPSKRSNEPTSAASEDGTSSGSVPQRHELSRDNSEEDDFGLTTDQKQLLIEVFFTTAFHSVLLFHKSAFLRSYGEGAISRHTVLAMWAMSSHFIHSQHIRARFDNGLIMSLGDAKALGARCAAQATYLVLRSAVTPSLDTAQTCLIMSTYHLTQGQYMQNAMFISIGSRAARMIHQDHIFCNPGQSWYETELERRALWTANWATLVNNDHYINGTSADQFMMNLSLPSSNEALDRGEQERSMCLLDTIDPTDVAQPRSGSWATNVSAELSRVILHWAKIQDHMVNRRRAPPQQSLLELLELDLWLTNWMENISPEIKYSKEVMYQQTVVKDNMCYNLIPGLFYLAKMTLHASVVPHFSGLTSTASVSPVTVRISAETALNCANEVANMAVDLIALNIDPSRFPPMYAHCMYVAATIHVAFISSSNAALSRSARKGLISTLTVLKLMKPYWLILKKLWNRIHLLYEAQLSRMPYPREPIDLFSSPIDPAQEIDLIANANRDTGRLDESLSASVLTYGHRKLTSTAEIDELSFTAQDLENKMRLGVSDAAVAMEEVTPMQERYSPQDQQRQPSQPQSSYTGLTPQVIDAGYIQPFQGQFCRQLNPSDMAYDAYNMDGIDWSHFDLNSLLVPLVAVNDNFDMPMVQPPAG